MSDFLSQVQVDEFDGPTEADWADYCDYLDSIGYDCEDDDWEENTDADRGFQNGVFDNIIF